MLLERTRAIGDKLEALGGRLEAALSPRLEAAESESRRLQAEAKERAALENVLIPNTEEQHRQRMRDAGFSVVEQCMRCLNFSTFLGIK